jgi:PAS domain S-box-containing protein
MYTNDQSPASLAYHLKGGGEMGRLTRAFDWSKSVLGSPDQWPVSLLTTLNILLNAKFPMFFWWGPDLIQFYNDAYIPSLVNDGKHPIALGQKGKDCWGEKWPVIKPMVDQVISGGEATWSEHQLIPVFRNGKLEDVYWTMSYSRVDNEAGEPAGVLVICNETTDLITKLQAIDELKAAEERYQILFTTSPLPKWIYDINTLAIVDVNHAALKQYGYSREEFLRMKSTDLLAPNNISPLLNPAADIRTDATIAYPVMYLHEKKDKTRLQMQLSENNFLFQNMNCMMVVGNDMTESLYYQQLDKLENRILQINLQQNHNLPDILNSYLAGIEELHPGMQCSMQQVKGTQLFRLASPSLPKEFLDAIEGGQIGLNAGSCGTAAFTKELVIVTDIPSDIRWANYKDLAAKYHFKACWSTPVLDKSGKVLATFANYFCEERAPSEHEKTTIKRAGRIIQVIMESFQREQFLKDSNEKYYYATKATSDAIWDWDLAAETMAWGQGYKTIFGYDEGGLQGARQSMTTCIHPEDLDRVLKGINAAVEGSETTWKDEYRYLKSDQTYADVVDKAIIIRDEKGNAIRMVGAMQDVTRQRQEERLLKLLNEKLRKISWLQSHIVRAPLTRIMGLVHLLKDPLAGDEDRKTAYDYLLISADELDDVIKKITDTSNLP